MGTLQTDLEGKKILKNGVSSVRYEKQRDNNKSDQPPDKKLRTESPTKWQDYIQEKKMNKKEEVQV